MIGAGTRESRAILAQYRESQSSSSGKKSKEKDILIKSPGQLSTQHSGLSDNEGGAAGGASSSSSSSCQVPSLRHLLAMPSVQDRTLAL